MRSEKGFRLRPVRNTPVLVRGGFGRKGRLKEEVGLVGLGSHTLEETDQHRSCHGWSVSSALLGLGERSKHPMAELPARAEQS